ncbi:MAG TPA: GNAT family N-acetyltransferase, partial [Actinomycetota bacterium]|nr:GNAT family N-acetyltransferase [Actinomycetota bacterium]
IRPIQKDETEAFLSTLQTAFGFPLDRAVIPNFERKIVRDRMHVALDGDVVVGTAGTIPFTLTIPGGEMPTSGVTMVSVLPSHRRQGLLRQMMRRLLDDAHARGEALAILWASEDAIYQRFGYGPAADTKSIAAERDRVSFVNDPGPIGRTRLIDEQERLKQIPPIYDAVRRVTPGMYVRTDTWWETHSLYQSERGRDRDGPLLCALFEMDGVPEAYALYHVKPEWGDDAVPQGRVDVDEVMATTPRAEREIWRFIFGIDLIQRVHAYYLPPDPPLFLMVAEPRRLRLSHTELLWLRLVDVEAALRARSYATTDSLAIEVIDEFCPWNEGTYRIDGSTGSVDRTDGPADLRASAAALAAPYLGGFTFSHLARADRIEVLNEGALERADAMFATPRPPWCPENF